MIMLFISALQRENNYSFSFNAELDELCNPDKHVPVTARYKKWCNDAV